MNKGIPIGDMYKGYGQSMTTSQKSGITTNAETANKDTEVIVGNQDKNKFMMVFGGGILLLIMLSKYS